MRRRSDARHGMVRWSLVVVGGAIALVALGRPARSRKPIPPVCPPGRFLLPPGDAPLVPGAPAIARDVVIVGDDGRSLAIASGCEAVAGKVKATRRGTQVKGAWPACGTALKVRLTAKEPFDCATMTGTVRAKKATRRRFTAVRSTCGDGVVDLDGGEGCETDAECAAGAACVSCACSAGTTSTGPATSTTTVTTTTLDPGQPTTSTIVGGSTTTTAAATTTTTASASTSTTLDTGQPAPDPSSLAPPPPRGVTTGFAESIAFLYGGSGIQTGVVPGSIDPERVGVVRGRVLDVTGLPIPAVRVTILGHPEWGQTRTRTDGGFEMAANGGGQLVLVFTQPGYVTVQRPATPRWLDWTPLEDVVLTALDGAMTMVPLGGVAHVAQGSVVTDADGTRQATMIFPAGTTADLVMPDGSMQPIGALHVRATELTVGDAGPAAMPGTLPRMTAYTYAVELSVDEAIAAGADEVRFNQPIALHVDNFLGVPAGEPVPLGYYDRKVSAWVPAPNGRVVDILGVTGGLADLDADGDALADGAPALAALGVTTEERQMLAALYPTGGSVWRAPIPHLSSWDANWPYGLPPDAVYPPFQNPPQRFENDPCKRRGSVIGCEPQAVEERHDVTGTPFSLVYQSIRAPGRNDRHAVIRLAPDTVPASLVSATLQLSIAGQHESLEIPGLSPNAVHVVDWDGLDGYGRAVHGPRHLTGGIAYRYDAAYMGIRDDDVPGFGESGSGGSGTVTLADRAAKAITLGRGFDFLLGGDGPDAREVGLGGLTLNVHHVLDPETGTVFLGSGGHLVPPKGAELFAGDGTTDYPTDGAPATATGLTWPATMISGPDGTVYFNDGSGVYAFGSDDLVHRVVGCRISGCLPLAEGMAANALDLQSSAVIDVAVDSSGRLLVAIQGNLSDELWRVRADGTLTRLAGTRNVAEPTSGDLDGAVALDTALSIEQIAAGPDGTIYLSPGLQNGGQVLRLTGSGRLTRISGVNPKCGTSIPTGDGGDARAACTNPIYDLAVSPAGDVHLSTLRAVFRVTPDGILERVVGDPNLACGVFVPNKPPLETCLQQVVRYLAFDREGTLVGRINTLPSALSGAVLRIGDTVTVLAGGGTETTSGSFAASLDLSGAGMGLAIRPDGTLIVGNSNTSQLYRVFDPSAGILPGQRFVPAPDGRAAWIFDEQGRHLTTRDLLTGAVALAFGYDAAGRLASVTDSTGHVTTVERTAGGVPTALVAPGGQRTELQLNGDGFVSRITNPAGDHVDLTYAGVADGVVAGSGLVKTFVDARGRTRSYTWDGLGNLTSETTPLGDTMTVARTNLGADGFAVAVTAGGHGTTYAATFAEDGTIERHATSDDGAEWVTTAKPNGIRTLVTPEGVTTTVTMKADPRFGKLLPFIGSMTVQKGARTLTYGATRTVSGTSGFFGSGTLTEARTFAGRTTTRELDGDLRQIRLTSPAGRVRTITHDALGRATSMTAGGGLAAVTIDWLPNGLVGSITRGSASAGFGYDAKRRRTARTDAGARTFSVGFDAADRAITFTDPDGLVSAITWYPDGQPSSFALPGGAVHALDSNAYHQQTSYAPPGNPAAYQRVYAVDGTLSKLVLPSGREQVLDRDANGAVTGFTYDEATVTVGYAGAGDLPATLVRTPLAGSAQSIAVTYDANLPIQTTGAGAVASTLDVVYGNDFLPSGYTLTAGLDVRTYAVGFDGDGRPLTHGPVTFTRGGPDRAVSAITAGTGVFALTYSPEGWATGRSLAVDGTPRYAVSVTYDERGLPATRTETVNGVAHAFAYAHDGMGRLTLVERDGSEVEAYGYDARGNRTSAAYDGGAATASTFDAQDRQLTRAGTSLTLDVDGFLAAKGADGFTYTTVGELASATVDGVTVTYDYDGLRRLVRRNAPGGTTEFFYADPFDPFRPSAYRVQGEAMTTLLYDDQGFLVAMERDTARWLVATDMVGSPRVVVDDATGIVVKTIGYDAFGHQRTDSAQGFVLPIGYAGGIHDPTTGLVRMGRRDYDPTTGRWTARDPSFLTGGQLNLYAYVESSPVGYRDPSGQFCVGGSAFAGIGGGGKACISSKGFSACGELGFGVGEGIDASPFAEIDDNFIGTEIGAKVGLAGVVSAGCEGSYGADDFTLDPCHHVLNGDCKGGILGTELSPFKPGDGQTTGLLGPAQELGLAQKAPEPEGKLFQAEAKITAKTCQAIEWSLF